MNWPFFLGEHICLPRWMWNLPLLNVLTASSLHWSAVLGTQYASTVVFLCGDLPLSVVTLFFSFFFSFLGISHQIQADVDSNNQHLSSLSLTNYQLHVSPTVARSTLRPYPIIPLSVTLPSVCCCLGPRVRARTCSWSYASAACWWCQCMSSCTDVEAGSTRRGRRPPCYKLSTWRQFPSEDW